LVTPFILLGMAKNPRYIEKVTAPDIMTADELLRLGISELVRGRLVVREPGGFRHGVVAMNVASRLSDYVTSRGLGVVVAAETGFKLFSTPDTVRAPDAAFIRADRVPRPLPRGYAEVAPDLMVEVLSPDDRAGEVLATVGDWLTAGCRLVWVLDPERRLARVYRADASEMILSADDTLDGEDLLPGLRVEVNQLV
jgi:Uma2 family endonuclease